MYGGRWTVCEYVVVVGVSGGDGDGRNDFCEKAKKEVHQHQGIPFL